MLRNQKLFVLIILGAVLGAVIYLFVTEGKGAIPFDQSRWLGWNHGCEILEMGARHNLWDPCRLRMKDDLVARYLRPAMTVQEIELLLGKAGRTGMKRVGGIDDNYLSYPLGVVIQNGEAYREFLVFKIIDGCAAEYFTSTMRAEN